MNIYIQIISDLSYKNKYLKWYINIIENAQKRSSNKKEAKETLIYVIGHHIVLDSFFKERKRKGVPGDIDGNPDDPLNIVYLTPKEHLIVHRCLAKCLIQKRHIAKNSNALCRMLQSKNGIYNISAKLYDNLMKQFIENNPGKWESSIEKSKQTKLEKYGNEYYSNLEQYKETCLYRYNVDHFSKTEKYKETFTSIMLERYGVEHALQNEESKIKFKTTCLSNYNVEYPMQSTEIQQKSIETCLKKYGVENYTKTLEYKEKAKQTWLENYGVDNPGKRTIICEYCGELKNINHISKCIKNPNRIVRDIKGKNNPKAKYYRVLSPENIKYYIVSTNNLFKFAKENNLKHYSLLNNKIIGWTVEIIAREEYDKNHQ